MAAAAAELGFNVSSSSEMSNTQSETACRVTISVGVGCMYSMFSNTSGLSGAQAVISLGETFNASLAQGLFEQSGAALYLAKQRGRNSVMLQPQAAVPKQNWS